MANLSVSTIRPGFLVSLKTSVRGGVEYRRADLAAPDGAPEGAAVARWETTKITIDPAEVDAASKARSKARSLVAGVCSASAFGMLCPENRGPDLARAIEEARAVAAAFNATAKHTTIGVYVLAGRIAASDEEAAKAIASEVRELLDTMRDGIATADVEKIREAANKARGLGAMLSDDAAGKVSKAIEAARSAAREITRRVEKGGETAAKVVESIRLDEINAARFAFLDLDPEAAPGEAAPVPAAALDLAPASQEAPPASPSVLPGLDLTPAAPVPSAPSAAPARAFEV
jgi:hypothetical protein